MKVIGKDRTSCDVCNPIDEILARLDALERRASAIVAKVQGLAPDGEGNVTLPTSSSDTDPLHGRIDAFAMSSEVKETADDAHAYAASIADDVVVINSEIDVIKAEIEAIKVAVQTLQTTDTKNVKLEGIQNITGIKTVPTEATGTRSQQIANSIKIGAELDNYAPMVRTTGSQYIYGRKAFETPVFEGSKDRFREYTKFTDVVREEATNKRCYISTVLDSNDRGIVTVEVGVDESGKRAYYAIGFGGIVVNGNFLNSQLRLNLSETGVSMQLFDPISRTWKTAVLQ